MMMTNMQIYDIANALGEHFQDKELKMPIKINFYLQKNKNTLMALAQEIEQARVEIIRKYGNLDESSNQFIVPPESIAAATAELKEFFGLEQDVTIYKVNIEAFNNLELTTGQMEALLFMIEE